MQVNLIITNRNFPKVVLKKKMSRPLKTTLVQGNYYLRTHLVTCRTCKNRLATHSTLLTTRSIRFSTRSTRLSIRSTRFFTRSTRFSTRSTGLSIRLSIRSTRLSTRSICLSTRCTRSTICRSFYHWSFITTCYT